MHHRRRSLPLALVLATAAACARPVMPPPEAPAPVVAAPAPVVVTPVGPPPGGSLDPRVPLTDAQQAWVDRTLASLTLRQGPGQMVNVWVLGDYTNTRDPSFAEVLRWIEQDHVGGVTMSLGSP